MIKLKTGEAFCARCSCVFKMAFTQWYDDMRFCSPQCVNLFKADEIKSMSANKK